MNRATAVIAAALAVAACTEDAQQPLDPAADAAVAFNASLATAPAPSGLATVSFGGAALELWPYTSDDFASQTDPVNLVFYGNADPRTIRAALVGLSGDRTAFGLPSSFPFNCTWTDVPDGGIQAVYAGGEWAAGAIQLACGPYEPVRFHVRLFRAGAWTVGAAHFEFLVPGTTTHKILSWEAAEQLVALDMYRSGIAAPVDSAALGPAPAFRVLEGFLVGMLPAELKAVLCPAGVPWPCDGSADVPVLTNGYATIVYAFGNASGQPGNIRRTSTVTFDQVIPKPQCAGGTHQYMYVSGPITFREHWLLTPSNNYMAHFEASGTLTLVPIDPTTGTPLGAPYQATVYEEHRQQITDRFASARSTYFQYELPPDAPYHGTLEIRFQLGPNGVTSHSLSLTCGG